ADPESGDAAGRSAEQIVAAEPDRPAVWLVQAADAVEQRRLASTVGADQSSDRALVHPQRSAIEGRDAPERHREFLDFEHACPPAPRMPHIGGSAAGWRPAAHRPSEPARDFIT